MHNQRSHNRQPSCHNRTLEIKNRTRTMEKTKAEAPMQTMTLVNFTLILHEMPLSFT